jgi:hypothetical protein
MAVTPDHPVRLTGDAPRRIAAYANPEGATSDARLSDLRWLATY